MTDSLHLPTASPEPGLRAASLALPGSSEPPLSPGAWPVLFQPASYFERLDLPALFPKAQPLEVELGSGDGSFLVQYAQAYPLCNFLGVERLLGRLRKIDRKGRRGGLLNLRVLRVEASYFLEYMLPEHTVRALHIYFPDPWPKRKHWKNRLVNTRFTELAFRVLEPGGSVHLRTDDAPYFAQMLEVFGGNPQFRPIPAPLSVTEILTDFERTFRARGIASLTASYQAVSQS